VPKSKLIIGSIVIIAIAAIIVILPGGDKGSKSKLLSFQESKSVSQITVKSSKKGEEGKPDVPYEVSLDFSSDLSAWTIKDAGGLPIIVDATKVLKVFEFLNESKVLLRVTKKKENYGIFEVGNTKYLELRKLKGETVKVYLGKNKDYSSQYVRLDGDPYVYLITKTLNVDSEVQDWFYRKVLAYEEKDLNHIDYRTQDKKNIKVYYDTAKSEFKIDEVPPAGQEPKKLTRIGKMFAGIGIKGYLERASQKNRLKQLVKHTLVFQDDTSAEIRFMNFKGPKKDDNMKYYLDLKLTPGKNASAQLRYASDLSRKYLFELHSFNERDFHRKFTDFFQKKKEEPKKGS